VTACAVPPSPIPPVTVPAVSGSDGIVTDAEAAETVSAVMDDAPDPGSAAYLLSTVDSLSDTPLYRDSRAALLIDGPATYASMLEAIAAATSSIHLETYILADDEVGRRFADALTERSAAGVDVRIIYDSFGSRGTDAEYFERLKAAGIELQEFNKINPMDGGNPVDANNRTHRKLLIVDDKVAFTGGLNFSRFYSRSSSARPRPDPLAAGWRDTHVAIYGPAVQGFADIFAENWNAAGDGDNEALPRIGAVEKAGNDVIAALRAEGGDADESAIFTAYIEAMRLAKRRIWITQGYFAPDEDFMETLLAAANRGVDVRLIVPGFSDTNSVVHASRSRYGKLVKHGIRVFETTTTVLHAKAAVIDGIWSTVGSSNLDYRSFLHNDEVNAVIFGVEFASQMEAQFRKDLENTSEVTLESWKRRPLGDRFKEFFSWAVEYWL
jgi:cardiolipin synthase